MLAASDEIIEKWDSIRMKQMRLFKRQMDATLTTRSRGGGQQARRRDEGYPVEAARMDKSKR